MPNIHINGSIWYVPEDDYDYLADTSADIEELHHRIIQNGYGTLVAAGGRGIPTTATGGVLGGSSVAFVAPEDRDITAAESELNLLNAIDDFLDHHSELDLREFLIEEDILVP